MPTFLKFFVGVSISWKPRESSKTKNEISPFLKNVAKNIQNHENMPKVKRFENPQNQRSLYGFYGHVFTLLTRVCTFIFIQESRCEMHEHILENIFEIFWTENEELNGKSYFLVVHQIKFDLNFKNNHFSKPNYIQFEMEHVQCSIFIIWQNPEWWRVWLLRLF